MGSDSTSRRPRQRLSIGTAQNLAAELLVLPLGLLAVVYLTRRLGPHDFGLFTLATTFVGWLAWTSASLFSRATVALTSAADDWRAVAATVMRVDVAVGLLSVAAVWVSAGLASDLLGAPELAPYLRLFSIELLLFNLTRGHRSILAGVGLYKERASARAAYWVSRIVLIVVLVESGLSVHGALLGGMAATAVELAFYRRSLRVPFVHDTPIGFATLWSYAAPVAVVAFSRQLFNRVDLFAITTLGGAVADAGLYGAARNLALLPGLLAVSLSPLLLSSLRGLIKSGDAQQASRIAGASLRLVFGLLPFAAIVAPSSRGVAELVFGADFSAAGPLLALLIVAEVALLGFSVASTLVIARDRTRDAAVIGGLMLLLALPAHWVMIPRTGALGAAGVTMTLAVLGSAALSIIAMRTWRIPLPARTALRSLALAAAGYAAAAYGPAGGAGLVVHLSILGLLIPVGFYLLGEFEDEEIRLLTSMINSGSS